MKLGIKSQMQFSKFTAYLQESFKRTASLFIAASCILSYMLKEYSKTPKNDNVLLISNC